MTMTSKLPDAIVQEIRHLLAVHCKETVFGDAADGADTKGQVKMMEKVFHGSGGYASVVDKFIKGEGEYAKCFQKIPMQNNREGNEERSGTTEMLQLMEVFHCDEESIYIVHERGFTRDALAETKGEKVPGRTLSEKAVSALANYKFALMYTNEFMIGGKYPSGKTFEDLALFVRQQMYLQFRGGKSNKSKKNKDVTVEEMPDKYFFHGYMAWALYCPHGLGDTTLSCMSVDGKNTGTGKGRKAARGRVADIKNKDRQMDRSGARGISMNDQLAAAALRDANRNVTDANRNVSLLLVATMTDETNTLKQIDQVEQMIVRATSRGNTQVVESFENRQANLYLHLDEVADRKQRLNEESERRIVFTKKPKLSTVVGETQDEMSAISTMTTARSPSGPSTNSFRTSENGNTISFEDDNEED